MPPHILLDRPLSWRQVADIADGVPLALSDDAQARIRSARRLVESIVTKGVRAYGVNTGVGALCDVVVTQSKQEQLSRNILMSHAVGVGPTLGSIEVRAIIAAAINNFALGLSGVRPVVVERLLALLAHDCVPEVPAAGSVGYLTHMAHIALVLIGEGSARSQGRCMSGAEALRSMELAPLVLGAKEGLSLVNGTPCATGLSAVALGRVLRLLDWADTAAAHDLFAHAARVVDDELASVTDNPVVMGTADEPRALSGANAVGAALGLMADSLGIAVAEVAAMSERRVDRLVNPLVSGLPAFLATDEGAGSGFMIAQYTAASLAADNRRLAAPASLDGGVSSGLQEDHPSLLPLVLMRKDFLDELLDAAPAVDRDDLAGNVGCVSRQKQGGARNVLRGAVALQGGFVDDFPLQLVLHVALRPQHRSRCNAVDADFRSQLARQRPGQHREARLGRAVHRMCLEGTQAVDIDHIDDESALPGQARCGGLREEQGSLQVAAHEVVPLGERDLPHRGRVEAGGVVDQDVQAPKFQQDGSHQFFRGLRARQLRRVNRGRMGTDLVESVRQGDGGSGGGAIMNEYIGSGGVQRACYLRADPARAAGDEHDLAAERRTFDTGFHGHQRYRNGIAA
jgi:histidine ammonia-lyase